MKITAAQYQAGAHTETPATTPERHGGIQGRTYGDPTAETTTERVGAFEQVVTRTDYGEVGHATTISARRITNA